MYQSIVILGRQPKLGIAELESLYGSDNLKPFGQKSALLKLKTKEINFNRLGGVVKLAKILTKLEENDWISVEDYLIKTTPEHAKNFDSKLTFGISTYGVKISPKKLSSTAINVKKAIKKSGASVRMVPHKDLELNSAVVLHNKLTENNNWELLIVSDEKDTYLAQTTNIQNIDAYALRDRNRPKRDAKVGMLPPKLAQIIINLAAGQNLRQNTMLLDPFCGTGVVLQEAMLLGYDVYGTDINPKMLEYTNENLGWLFFGNGDKWRLEEADATKFKWKLPINLVASETFLGHPLSKLPNDEHLSKIIYESNVINHRFLINLSTQIKSGTRLCLAMPTWRGKREFLHLPLLDHLTDMGYTRISFKHVSKEDLIYHREGQVVGRELLVLIKN